MTVDHFESPLMLSSELPASMTIHTTQPYVEVSIMCNNKTEIFTTTIYTYSGTAVFSDFRELIEDYMEEQAKSFAIFSIECYDYLVHDGTQDFSLIYCRHLIPGAAEFATTHYLTLRKSVLFPRGETFIVPYYLAPDETNWCSYDCTLLPIGSTTPIVKSIDNDQAEESGENVISEAVSYREIRQLIAASFPDLADARLLAVTVRRAARSLTIYYTDHEPDLCLEFRNTFNALVPLYLYGTLTTKTDMERTEASCLGTSQFYDETIDQTFEFETSFLTPEEAFYINQLLTSTHITANVPSLPLREILITDMTSEISDRPSDTIRIKFTFKYATPAQFHSPAASKDIFTEQYTHIFQ